MSTSRTTLEDIRTVTSLAAAIDDCTHWDEVEEAVDLIATAFLRIEPRFADSPLAEWINRAYSDWRESDDPLDRDLYIAAVCYDRINEA